MPNQDPSAQDTSGWMDALEGQAAQSEGFQEAHADLVQDRPADAPKDGPASLGDINMVMEIPVQISVELGRTRVPIKYILQLAQGSVVELDALAGAPMDVLVNGYLIAQGEVVVVNEKFGIRLTDVVTPAERLRRASRQHGT